VGSKGRKKSKKGVAENIPWPREKTFVKEGGIQDMPRGKNGQRGKITRRGRRKIVDFRGKGVERFLDSLEGKKKKENSDPGGGVHKKLQYQGTINT